jgi:MFS family permease
MSMSTSRYSVLGYRDFRFLLLDRLLAPAAFAFSMVGVSFAVLDRTDSTADLSYVLAAQIAPTLVFALIGGVIADRVRPQLVIAAANLMVALCEGTLGILVMTHRATLPEMILLEAGTGIAVAIFYPASQALLPKLVPEDELQQANAISRLVMNGSQMGGAAVAGILVAAVGPGWALTADAAGMLLAVPFNLLIRAGATERGQAPGFVRDLREGWVEFRSRTWLWATVIEYGIILMAWYGSFSVLGPAVAQEHLGGPAAWGTIMAAESVGLIVGGVGALRFTPKRPMLFVAVVGAGIGLPSLALAMLWPLWLICVAAFSIGVIMELMMVQWNVAMATRIPSEMLARVSAYDVLGTVMAMPLGAVVAGPLAAEIGVARTQYAAVVVIVIAAAAPLLSREIRDDRGTPARTVPLGAGPGPIGVAGATGVTGATGLEGAAVPAAISSTP